jgi:hypothetical protein
MNNKNICVMSFDIGIKNMAYCTFVSNKGQMNISDWSILNITKSEIENIPKENKCSCIIGNKTKICNKKAIYEKNGKYYCAIHAKSTGNWIIPVKKIQKGALKKLKKDELFNLGCEYNILVDDDLKLIKSLMLEKITNFFISKCFVKIDKCIEPNSGDINLIILGRNMKRLLDKVQYLDQVTHVILENQISPIASRMKTIQGMLAQYFIMKYEDKIHISFVSSSNKLKIFPLVADGEMITNKYKRHKNDAIFHTVNILEKNAQFSSWSEKMLSNKKDDLADCFLQGIWYLKKENYITIDNIYKLDTNSNR